MRRNAEDWLKAWVGSERRKPLILRGARQVGKSTLVRQTAQAMGLPLWEANLERHPQLISTFQTMDVEKILLELGLALRCPVGKGKGILFLDEIQAIPQALAALRYFHEERPDLPVVAAGSLLEFALESFPASMPVGRIEFHHLGPLGFLEFAEAAEGRTLTEFVQGWKLVEPWPDTAHDILSGRLREFLVAGAMPEAAAAFLESGDPGRAQAIHRSILETYREDFGKYTKGAETEKVRRVFDSAPSFMGRKMRWNRVNPAWKSGDLRKAFDQLERAGVVAGVRHSDGLGIPLGVGADESVFKVLFLDGALAQTAMGLPPLDLESFRTARFVNEGPLAEQFVGQHLRFLRPGMRPELHHWLREGKTGNAEVDFLVQVDDKVVPVEVKSGTAGSMRSLHQFMALRGGDLAVRLDMNPPSIQDVSTVADTPLGRREIRYRLLSLPLMLVERLPDLVRQLG